MARPEKIKYFPKTTLIISVIILGLLIILGGYLYYRQEKKAIWKEKSNDLQAIAQLKANQIYDWLNERISEAYYFSQNPAFRVHADNIAKDKENRKSLAYFNSRLKPIQEKHGYENMFLVDKDRKLLFSIYEMNNMVDSVTADFADSAMLYEKVFLTGFYYCTTHEKVHIDIVAPIMNKNDNPVAALVLRIDPNDYLFPLIQSWPTASKTSETHIIREDGDSVLFLNELRHMKNTAMKLRVSKERKDIPAVQAVMGSEGVFEGKDYRDVKVLSVIKNIPGTPWYMIAKVDKDEIFSALYFKSFAIIVFVIVLILLGSASLAWIYHYRQRNIYRGLYNKEKELSESQEMLKRSQEIAHVGSWDYDIAINRITWSEETYMIFDILSNEFNGTFEALLECIHHEDRDDAQHSYRNSIDEKYNNFEMEFRIIQKHTGENKYVFLKCDHIKDNKGNVCRSVGMIQDITERKEFEQKLIKQNKEYQSLNEEYLTQNNEYQRLNEEYVAQNDELTRSLETLKQVNAELEEAIEKAEESDRLKTAFLNNMSHEIRTPMNAIMGFANLLQEEDFSSLKQQKHIDIINNNAEQLIKIVDDIIDISRLEAEKTKLERINFTIGELFDDLYQTFNESNFKQDVNFEYALSPELKDLSILADRQKIRQVLSGFIENAFKYTKSGSVVFGCNKQDDDLRFYVKDSGMGIPEKELPNVFDRFFRGEKIQELAIGGTGLGLSIAKNLVKLMNGEIGVESEIGKGSLFYFTIPYKEGKPEKQEHSMEKQTENRFKDLSVLIVDDEPDSLEYLKLVLKNMVKKVDKAKNGEEAVEMANKKEYSLVLMDIKMPVLDGLEASKAIREKHPDTIIIAQTAYAQKEERAKALATGCNDYLTKPIRKSSLLSTLEKFFAD